MLWEEVVKPLAFPVDSECTKEWGGCKFKRWRFLEDFGIMRGLYFPLSMTMETNPEHSSSVDKENTLHAEQNAVQDTTRAQTELVRKDADATTIKELLSTALDKAVLQEKLQQLSLGTKDYYRLKLQDPTLLQQLFLAQHVEKEGTQTILPVTKEQPFLPNQRYTVDFAKDATAERNIGLGDLLPLTVRTITLHKPDGTVLQGTRQTTPRPGYYTASGDYLPIFSGDQFSLPTTPEGTSAPTLTTEDQTRFTKEEETFYTEYVKGNISGFTPIKENPNSTFIAPNDQELTAQWEKEKGTQSWTKAIDEKDGNFTQDTGHPPSWWITHYALQYKVPAPLLSAIRFQENGGEYRYFGVIKNGVRTYLQQMESCAKTLQSYIQGWEPNKTWPQSRWAPWPSDKPMMENGQINPEFIYFLQVKYCPTPQDLAYFEGKREAIANDPTGLNQHWKSGVSRYLSKWNALAPKHATDSFA